MGEKIIVCFSFKSVKGKSIYKLEDLRQLSVHTFHKYVPEYNNIKKTAEQLQNDGFEIEAITEVGLSVSGDIEKLETYFHTTIHKRRIDSIKSYEVYEYVMEQEPWMEKQPEYIEKIYIQKQFFVLGPDQSLPRPILDYYHLNLPDDIQRIGNVDIFYSNNCYGEKVKVTLIDTGFYYEHSHFQKMKYTYKVIPAISNFDISKDERGHGSGMSSVMLSIAPRSNFTMIKASDLHISYPLTAFQKAVNIGSHIISCSWGTIGLEPQLHLEIVNARHKEIIVVFAAGNGSCDKVTSKLQTIAHPEVISVGGCYPDENGKLQASNLSSSYYSNIYVHRFCPDLCGICGMKPYGQLILFPSQPASVFDKKNGERDGTKQDDGWFVSSGTSAAAAYVSGMIALSISYAPNIRRSNIKDLLIRGCQDVLEGKNFMRYSADVKGWNKAVGYGFLDGHLLFHAIKDIDVIS